MIRWRFKLISTGEYEFLNAIAKEHGKLKEDYETLRSLYYDTEKVQKQSEKMIKKLLPVSEERAEIIKDYNKKFNKINNIILIKQQGVTPTNKLNQIKELLK